MYLSASQYPEFSDKGKPFVVVCLRFCVRKKPFCRRLLSALFIIIVLWLIWGFWLEDTLLGESAKQYFYISPVLSMILSYSYFMYEINVTIRNDVKAHIAEFRNENV